MDRPRPLIAGNWKMNGLHAEGAALAAQLKEQAAGKGARNCEILVCPPFTLLHEVGRILAGGPVALGAQDCHESASGAFTGDISAAMLKDAGCRYVIVGHSERRGGHGETDPQVRRKAAAAQQTGLSAIVCVGETEAERDRGQTVEVIARQVANSLPQGGTGANTVIAYEPVWAIGTGRTPQPGEIAAVHRQIRAALAGLGDAASLRVIYGGSVKADNAAGLLAIPEVNGALVGGASLKAEDFWAIVESCP